MWATEVRQAGGFATLDKLELLGEGPRMSNLAHIKTCFRVCPIAGA